MIPGKTHSKPNTACRAPAQSFHECVGAGCLAAASRCHGGRSILLKFSLMLLLLPCHVIYNLISNSVLKYENIPVHITIVNHLDKFDFINSWNWAVANWQQRVREWRYGGGKMAVVSGEMATFHGDFDRFCKWINRVYQWDCLHYNIVTLAKVMSRKLLDIWEIEKTVNTPSLFECHMR